MAVQIVVFHLSALPGAPILMVVTSFFAGEELQQSICSFLPVFWGLMIGTIVFSVSAFVFWLFGYDFGLLISVFSGIAVTAAASVILYFRLFRPTSEAIARRLDEELNLEERMITMLELSKDESYIALCQREDAKKRLNSIKNAKIPRRISRLSVGLASGFSGLAVVIAGVFILSILDFLPRGLEILKKCYFEEEQKTEETSEEEEKSKDGRQ